MAENKVDCLPRAQRPREEDEVWSKGEMGYPRRSLLPCEDTPIELVSDSFDFYPKQSSVLCRFHSLEIFEKCEKFREA
ncbi:unnamed protein product [Anisakis simplex]|uniref:Uncharacterized protein n=1 Tax=Anisakis simplex TaxID=6269 RepID=A0A0M3KG48_ANISI|nr:unnamed protein product [Anisakis simplex]